MHHEDTTIGDVTRGEEIATLIVCEEDEVTRELLCDHLSADRFAVLPAPSVAAARRFCGSFEPDLLLVGQSLPDGRALDLLHEIREADEGDPGFDPELPVIVLCGPGRDDHLRVLDSGADDFVIKPVGYSELRTRIEAALRRRGSGRKFLLRVGELVVDIQGRQVRVGGRSVHLARREFDLLRVLAGDPTRVFSKEELYLAVWNGQGRPRSRVLDAHASRLRRRLDPDRGRFVVNCWGIGYRLIDRLPPGSPSAGLSPRR